MNIPKSWLFYFLVNTAVELVIDQAFCSLEGQIKGTPNDYVVKVS